jgi:hypothetical protein
MSVPGQTKQLTPSITFRLEACSAPPARFSTVLPALSLSECATVR